MSVTIRGYTYRSSIATVNGAYMVGVSADNRAGAGVAGGDEVDVDIELDTAPREVACRQTSPPRSTRSRTPAAPSTRLSYSNRCWHVLQIEGAKTDETRQRRIARSIEALRDGRVR